MQRRLFVSNTEILVTRKKVKYLRLSVSALKREVRVSAPYFVSDESILQFVESKTDWIETQMQKYRTYSDTVLPQFVSGESHSFFGQAYPLKIINTEKTGKADFKDDEILLYCKENSTAEQREKLVNEWYRECLKERIPTLLHKWEQVIGVSAKEFTVRNMKTRWGTCNIRRRRICFNLQLAKRPVDCLEYIVVHELVHLLESGHGEIFKAYMDQFLPDWRLRKRELNRIG